jgi:hypothetical protein
MNLILGSMARAAAGGSGPAGLRVGPLRGANILSYVYDVIALSECKPNKLVHCIQILLLEPSEM